MDWSYSTNYEKQSLLARLPAMKAAAQIKSGYSDDTILFKISTNMDSSLKVLCVVKTRSKALCAAPLGEQACNYPGFRIDGCKPQSCF